MKALVVAAVVVFVASVLLWRELRGPAITVESAPRASTSATSSSAVPLLAAPVPTNAISDEGDVQRVHAPAPVGGVRAWSKAPAPTTGPDPFAPVVEVRTEEDTRAGLD